MLAIRESSKRGQADHGWLKTQHSFSFADYYDPANMGFRTLRVINEDHVASGMGFGTHPHKDMEIITVVMSGALQHKDSMGNTATILPGEVQHMSAGTGVRHSEFNPSSAEGTHLMQIWILPEKLGIEPRYGQKSFAEAQAKSKLVLAASKTGRDGSIPINQDADLFLGRLKAQEELPFPVRPGRGIWLQVIKGGLTVNGQTLKAGDGLSLENELQLTVKAEMDSDFLLFDLI